MRVGGAANLRFCLNFLSSTVLSKSKFHTNILHSINDIKCRLSFNSIFVVMVFFQGYKTHIKIDTIIVFNKLCAIYRLRDTHLQKKKILIIRSEKKIKQKINHDTFTKRHLYLLKNQINLKFSTKREPL